MNHRTFRKCTGLSPSQVSLHGSEPYHGDQGSRVSRVELHCSHCLFPSCQIVSTGRSVILISSKYIYFSLVPWIQCTRLTLFEVLPIGQIIHLAPNCVKVLLTRLRPREKKLIRMLSQPNNLQYTQVKKEWIEVRKSLFHRL